MSDPVVLAPREGETLDVFGTQLTVKASGAETAGAYSLIESTLAPGSFGPLPHRHLDREESFFVLQGEFDFRVGQETVRAAEGSFLLVPRGHVHTFSNAGEVPARLLLIHSPSFEGYFVELSRLAAAGAPDLAALGELMTKWGMEVVTT